MALSPRAAKLLEELRDPRGNFYQPGMWINLEWLPDVDQATIDELLRARLIEPSRDRYGGYRLTRR